MSGAELDVSELKRWMREYTPRLLAVVQAFASAEVEAEDLLQEVWLKAYRSALVRAPDVPVVGWLTVIALNVGRDHVRRRGRRERLRRLWGWTALQRTVPTPEFGELHPRSRLWLAVGRLPTVQRQVVILRVVEGLSIAETARILGRAEGTVKASMSRALQTLRREFSGADPVSAIVQEATQ
ncbi:MAG TPA: RNA polymerase sigma factor [Gemmatimonadales bacterium]|nr:RNA polymerase sigma factor [Gemmatimonadales bacterium]